LTDPEQRQEKKSMNLLGASIVIVPAIFIVGYVVPKPVNWFSIMFLLALFLVLIGKYITDKWWGVFINERNKIALSRFQLVVWTLIIISAFLTIALLRIREGSSDPLGIALPQQLWELLGISVTSLVGSPLILSTKISKTSKDFKERQKADKSLTEPKFGILAFNDGIKKKPKFSEMFTGDEDGNEDSIDLAKVQMFFFTIIIAFSYVVLLFNLINTTSADIFRTASPFNFPALTDSAVALLGISSAGYLANKTYDKTKT
jgi:energy-coupling factor transporter transmembrane protein EcfT